MSLPQICIGNISGTINGNEILMIKAGCANVNSVIQSDEFRTSILCASFTETNDLRNDQIYDLFCSKIVEIDVEMYLGSWWTNHVSKTIGYEDEPGKVYCNRYFVKTAYMIGDNLIHEGLGHSMGFSHYGVKSTSVPYILNAIYEKIAAMMGITNV